MNLFNQKIALLVITAALLVASCKKDKTPEPETTTSGTNSYTVPTTYSFSSVNFTTSTQRISMLAEMLTYIKTTHTTTVTPGAVLDAQKLKDMYANVNNQFADATLNSSGIQLKDHTSSAFSLPTDFDANWVDAVTASNNAAANPTATTASNGTAGKLISGTKAYLVDANGVEYKEFAEKGIMGGVLYYQATTLLNNIATYDNSTVTNGTTAQERAWDEAFGYFGVPVDFPTNVTGLKNWGSYCNAVNAAIGSNSTIMNAWLKGRAAISNKDDAGRDAARDIVVKTWEKIGAARFITYVKAAKTNFADDAVRNHSLSEAIGFIRAFRYNPAKTISDTDINTLMNYFIAAPATTPNLYQVTSTNLDNAIAKMAFLFNLDASTL